MPSTVVSFCRRPVREEIPGMQDANYFLPAAIGKEPVLLNVSNSYYYKPDLDGNQDRILVQSNEIANCIVHMHLTSQLMYRVDRHPALFWVPEEITPDDVMHKFESKVNEVLQSQKNWFQALVRLADDDWQTLPKHRMISDLQRTACKELGLSRPWLNSVPDEAKVTCPYCGSDLLDSVAPICPHCSRVINPARLAEIEAMLTKVNPVTGKKHTV